MGSTPHEEFPEQSIPRGNRMFQINEDDLCDLERIVPEICDRLQLAQAGKQQGELLTKIRKLQIILTNIRWNYGPHSETEGIDAQ